MMKKKLGMVLIAAIVSMGLVGYVQAAGISEEKTSDKLQIVTTIYPEYDWVKQVLGNHAKDADITLLVNDGEDMHTYQPTAEDIEKIEESDLFVYVGGESDEWAKDLLKDNKEIKTVNLMEALGEDAEKDDEHVWLSVKNAKEICKEISKTLGEIDLEHAADYKMNLGVYMEKLNALDYEFKATVNGTADKKILVSDKSYSSLMDDYKIKYSAAENTKQQQVVEMNMMGNITDESSDYVHLMGQNLDALRDGLRK